MMLIYKFLEHINHYSITSGSLFDCYRDEPALNDNGCSDNNPTDLFRFKDKVTCMTGDNGTKDNEVSMPLKYLINYCRTLEIPLIHCETNFTLNSLVTCVISTTANVFVLTDTKIYIPLVKLFIKLLQQLISDSKRTIYWNKYQSQANLLAQNPYLNCLIDQSFQGVNRLFVFPFGNNAHKTSHQRYFLLTVRIKDYNHWWSKRFLSIC